MPSCEAKPDMQVKSDMLLRLLRRVGGGDRDAFNALHALCRGRLLACARRFVASRAVAEEVLQESLIAIWRDAASFDSTRSAPITWMVTIVRNKAIDNLRAGGRRELLTDHDSHDAAFAGFDPAAGPCEVAELAQRSRQLQHGLATLGQLQRQAIELAFFHELTHGEVAAKMTLPLGTVKTWIRRGCTQVRRHLEQPPHALTASACRSTAYPSAPPGKWPG